MEWFITHHRDLLEVVLAAHGVAVLIVNLTPTPKDNEIVRDFYRAIEMLAGIWTPLVKR